MSGSRNSLKRAQTFNPRANNDWSKDDCKFGQKLLEKMGWKKGQGIGLNNQGIVDNIKVRLKLDSKGLGYKIKEDQWLEVRSEFSDLLAQLNESTEDDNETINKEKKSLEAISQSSRTRVHYHKFTHGKDIAKYKKEDLIGILGKKEESEKSAIPEKEEFIQSGNMEEYFKNKRKQKRDTDQSENTVESLENPVIDERTDNEKISHNCSNDKDTENSEEKSLDKSCHRQKKSKNSTKENVVQNLNDIDASNITERLDQETVVEENQILYDGTCDLIIQSEKISKKKRKHQQNNSEQTTVTLPPDDEDTSQKNSKKKQKRSINDSEPELPKDDIEVPESNTVDLLSDNENIEPATKSKKKRKFPDNSSEETKITESNTVSLVSDDENTESQKNPKKKRKYSKKESKLRPSNDKVLLSESNTVSLVSDDEHCSNRVKESKKKPKKKRKNSQEIPETESSTIIFVSENETESSSTNTKENIQSKSSTLINSTNEIQILFQTNSTNEQKENNFDEKSSKKKRKPKTNDTSEDSPQSSLPFCIDVTAESEPPSDELPVKKKKKSKKEKTESTPDSVPLLESEQDKMKNSVSVFMDSVTDYNDSKSVEDYIKHFEKNRDELLNKYREKYKEKFLLSAPEILVFGDEFDGRKLDVKTPKKPLVNSTYKRGEKTKMSRAERIVAKARLLKSIKDKAATHNFKGSNLAKIQGYGNVLH